MIRKNIFGLFVFCTFSLGFFTFATTTLAFHAWGPPYHWARTANPLVLKLGNNVTSSWNPYLSQASNDWSTSSVLDTTLVPGLTRAKNCRPTAGRVEVCNAQYGNNSWLGIAQIWITGGIHITQATVKLNDTYHNNPPYNSPSWKQFVICQELGHTFGLDHTDENFGNPNLGTCMDYTNIPDGPPSNEHPNAHDFEQLGTIYQHMDSFNTSKASLKQGLVGLVGRVDQDSEEGPNEPRDFGEKIKDNQKVGLYSKNVNKNTKLFTFVIWTHD